MMRFRFKNVYTFHHYAVDGTLKGIAKISNLVTTEGLNDVMTQYFTGSGYTATWFCGLVSNASFGSFGAGDTAAEIGGTNDWTEFGFYSGTRPALVLGTITGGAADNSASLASFTFGTGGTLKGGFLVSDDTIGGTDGVLFGEGPFDDGMTLDVDAGETITMQVSLSAVSA